MPSVAGKLHLYLGNGIKPCSFTSIRAGVETIFREYGKFYLKTFRLKSHLMTPLQICPISYNLQEFLAFIHHLAGVPWHCCHLSSLAR